MKEWGGRLRAAAQVSQMAALCSNGATLLDGKYLNGASHSETPADDRRSVRHRGGPAEARGRIDPKGRPTVGYFLGADYLRIRRKK